MITINFEAWVLGPTGKHLVYITATGTTPDEVRADAERQRSAINAVEMMSVGLKNREADWISMYGANYSADCKFADSPCFYGRPPPPIAWYRRLFGI